MEDLFAKWAGEPIPEGMDEALPDFKDLPAGKWFLGQTPPAGSGAAWQVEAYDLSEPSPSGATKFGKLRIALSVLGAEPSVDPKQGPYSTVFGRLNTGAWDDQAKASDDTETPVALKSLANALLSPDLPPKTAERWQNTLALMAAAASEAGATWEAYQTEGWSPAMFWAACFALAVNSGQPKRLVAKTKIVQGKPYTDRNTGETVTPKPRLTFGNWEEASDANLAKHKIQIWEGR